MAVKAPECFAAAAELLEANGWKVGRVYRVYSAGDGDGTEEIIFTTPLGSHFTAYVYPVGPQTHEVDVKPGW